MIYDDKEFMDILIHNISTHEQLYDKIEGGDELSDVLFTVIRDTIIDQDSSALFESAEELYDGGFFDYVSFDNGLLNAIKSAQYEYYMDIVYDNIEELKRIFLDGREEVQ